MISGGLFYEKYASSNDFQNGMTLPGSTHNHRGDGLQGKALYAGPVVTGGEWALALPTPKLAATSLLSPENFVQIGPAIQKLFMIFQNADTQTNHPCTMYRYGQKNYALFSTSHKMESASRINV